MSLLDSDHLPTADHGLIHALSLNNEGPSWVHLERGHQTVRKWLAERADVPTLYIPAIVDDAARPRAEQVDDHVLIVLRGANMNEGDEPHDLIGLRLWLNQDVITTVRLRPVQTIQSIRKQIDIGEGPETSAEFLSAIVTGLTKRLHELVESIDIKVDTLEEQAEAHAVRGLREDVVATRQMIAGLRRYMAPQRDALVALSDIQVDWLTDEARAQIAEQAQNTVRLVEALEELKERASVIHDDLMADVNERMNRTMYILALVSILLLPPSLLTGLFGINVGGMPMVDSPLGFWVVLGAIPGLIAACLVVLRWLRWL